MSALVKVRMLSAADASLLELMDADIFDDPIDPGLTAEFLADPRHHMAAALVGERIVGMASAVHYLHPDKQPELWINEVGVAPHHQRQGIGRRLLKALIAHGRALGCREAWVLTEQDNAPARGLYSAAGGKEETVVYYTFPIDGVGDGPC